MHITIEQPVLQAALTTAIRAIDPRPNLPILGNFLFQALDPEEGGGLVLTSNNISMIIVQKLACTVLEPGKIALPAQTLRDLVATLDKKAPVEIRSNDDNLSASVKIGKKTLVALNGMSADEYPPVEFSSAVNSINLSAEGFCLALRSTLYAAASPEIKPILAGGSIQCGKDGMVIIAGDTYRIAIQKMNRKVEGDPFEIVIPSRSLSEVASIFASFNDDLQVVIGARGKGNAQARFQAGNTTVFCQILDGKTILKVSMIPTEFETRADIEVDELKNGLLRARIFAQDSNYRVALEFGADEVRISSKSAERGGADDSVACVLTGMPFTMNLNLAYLLDAIDSFSGAKTISFEYSSKLPALFLKSADRTGLLASISKLNL